MKTFNRWAVSTLLFTTLLFSSISNAALVGRDLDGNRATAEAYYDADLDLTWSANANLNNLGGSNWNIQTARVAALTIGNFSGWSLPSADVNNDSVMDWCNTTREAGCLDNQMAHLYWIEGITSATPGPFSGLLATTWWSSTEYASVSAWYWDFRVPYSSMGAKSKGSFSFAWAVQSGDIGTSIVPVPAAVWLFGSGLIGLVGIARRKKVA